MSEKEGMSDIAKIAGGAGGLFFGATLSDSIGGGNLTFVGGGLIIGFIIAVVTDVIIGQIDEGE